MCKRYESLQFTNIALCAKNLLYNLLSILFPFLKSFSDSPFSINGILLSAPVLLFLNFLLQYPPVAIIILKFQA